MSKLNVWLVISFAPLLLILTITSLAFFIRVESDIVQYATFLRLIPIAIPISLTVYIVTSKYFLKIHKKTVFATAIIVFVATSSALLWAALVYFNPQLLKNALPTHTILNTVYQDLHHGKYAYSWHEYLNETQKKVTHVAHVSEQEATAIDREERLLNATGQLDIEHSKLFQPFLQYLIYNARYSTKRSFITVFIIAIMLSCIYLGMNLASLWTANIFLQIIFLVGVHGTLNIILNLLMPYVWLLIVFMAACILLFLLFIIFRLYYDVEQHEISEDEAPRFSR